MRSLAVVALVLGLWACAADRAPPGPAQGDLMGFLTSSSLLTSDAPLSRAIEPAEEL
jgi:hypothetical protein